MRKSILIPLLVIACGTAQAEWRPVASAVNSTGYADADSIRRSGVSATMRVLIDYLKPPFDGNNLPYRSLTMQNEYHCEEARFRVLSITSHAGNMGRGDRPYTTDEVGEWEVVTNASIQKEMWKLACSKAALPAPRPIAPAS
jgi:hypothetical protein